MEAIERQVKMGTDQRSTPNFAKLFAAVPTACVVLDNELTIVAATDAFFRTTRTTRESLTGKRFFDVFPGGSTMDEASNATNELRASIEGVLLSGNSDVMPVQRLLVPRPDASGGGYAKQYVRRSTHAVSGPKGEVTHVIHQIEDVTVEVELDTARSSAESSSAAKSNFLSSMSHELRTPLNAMLGFAQLLAQDRREPLSLRHSERVAQVLKGGEHVVRLLDDILDLSRIETKGISISVEPVDVLDALSDVLDLLAPNAQAAGVRLDVMPGLLGVPLVSADRTRFVQMLVNLGSNGIKYNRRGGSVAFGLSWQEDDWLVCVRVVDTGLGIANDKQHLIFRPFERAGQELGPIDGSGIGLALTKRLAELMGGDVGFTSVAGEGSEFWVRVPVHDARRRSSSPPPPAAGPQLTLITPSRG